MIDVFFAVGLILVFPNGESVIKIKAFSTLHECRESRNLMSEEIAKLKGTGKTEFKFYAGECTAIPVKEE